MPSKRHARTFEAAIRKRISACGHGMEMFRGAAGFPFVPVLHFPVPVTENRLQQQNK